MMYTQVDEIISNFLTSNNISPACKKGCNACCESVTVLARPEEMPSLVRALNGLDKNVRKNIALKIKEIDKTWVGLPKYIDSNKYDPEAAEKHLREFAYRCPLLGAHGCLIYNDRPLVCRAYYSTDPKLCEDWAADLNLIPNFEIDPRWHSPDGRIVMPMPLFRNIDFRENRFIDLTKGRFFWIEDEEILEEKKDSLTMQIAKKIKWLWKGSSHS